MLELDRVDHVERRGPAGDLVTAGPVYLEIAEPGRDDSIVPLVRRSWRWTVPSGRDQLALDLQPPLLDRALMGEAPSQEQPARVDH